MNTFSLRTGMGKIGLNMLVQMLILVVGATSLWAQSPTATPTATNPTSSEFVVTDFYVPTAWMFYPWSTQARSSFTDQYTANCVTAKCIKISWAQPAANEWIGLYWLHPLADGGGGWSGEGQPGCDFRGATSVKFWARGEKGGEVVNFAAAFYWNHFVPSPLVSTTLTKQWVEYTIDLSSANLNNVVGAFGYYAFASQNPSDFTFYVDKITYQGIESSQLTCLTDLTATPTTTATATNGPTATSSVNSEFVATSFYVPTAWMFNGLSEAEIQTNFRFDDEYSTNCLSIKCIKISWKQPTNGQQIGQYWLHPEAGGGGSWAGQSEPGCDLTGATSVKFWARGGKGGEIVNFVAAFYWGREVPSPLEATTLTTEWTAFTIDLRSADLSNVVGAFGYYAFASQNPSDFTFFVDKISYQGIDPAQIACLTTATSTPTTIATTTPTATGAVSSTPTPSATATHPSGDGRALVLLYAALDNNLQANWAQLVNNIEKGITQTVDVRLYIDGPSSKDAFIYDVQADQDPNCPSLINITCNARYITNTNLFPASEDSAAQMTLANFISESVALYPDASQLIVGLIGHGSGWSAGVLPGKDQTILDQPRPWNEQPRPWNEQPGALLWDDHPSPGPTKSHSLSIKALDNAFYWAQQVTGQQIDLLYMDGCSLGMVEIAYEVRNHVRYMLASPNTDWTSFGYDNLLSAINPKVLNPLELGREWLRIDASVIRNGSNNYPYTYALVNLSKMEFLKAAVNDLATRLIDQLPENKGNVTLAFSQADRFESDYNGLINEDDAYSDLKSFAIEIKSAFQTDSAMRQSANSVIDAISQAVVDKDHQSGYPPISDDYWGWDNYGGLGVYMPLVYDEERRGLYNQSEIIWLYENKWADFLDKYLATQVNSSHADGELRPLKRCASTTDEQCSELAEPLSLTRTTYLPMVSN